MGRRGKSRPPLASSDPCRARLSSAAPVSPPEPFLLAEPQAALQARDDEIATLKARLASGRGCPSVRVQPLRLRSSSGRGRNATPLPQARCSALARDKAQLAAASQAGSSWAAERPDLRSGPAKTRSLALQAVAKARAGPHRDWRPQALTRRETWLALFPIVWPSRRRSPACCTAVSPTRPNPTHSRPHQWEAELLAAGSGPRRGPVAERKLAVVMKSFLDADAQLQARTLRVRTVRGLCASGLALPRGAGLRQRGAHAADCDAAGSQINAAGSQIIAADSVHTARLRSPFAAADLRRGRCSSWRRLLRRRSG